MTRPNIIYLHSHDTGRYISPYGHAARTPHLQKFAEQGTVFRQAFCANPTCSPSRAALLTGQWAHCAGMMGLAHRGFTLGDMNQHLIHTLKPAGYHTVLGGVQHVARSPDQIGYDQLLNPTDHLASHAAPVAADFLRSARARQPFFLDIGFFETHRAFPQPQPQDDPRYTRPPALLPDTPETRRDMASFNTMANDLDQGVGQVLDALQQAGLADNTLVIITTDHGPAFPGMKCNLTDHGIGVMLMMRGPGIAAGQVIDAMVSQVDLFPTICDMTDIAPPHWLQGNSLLPLLRGEVDKVHDEIFAEVNFHAAYEPMRAVRTGRYKYIRRYSNRRTAVLPNCDDGDSKTHWLAHDWAQRPLAQEQLYDLVFDPQEMNNLAAVPEFQDVVAQMRDRLARWMDETNDPIRSGPLTVPAGVQITPVDSPSAGSDCETVTTARPAE